MSDFFIQSPYIDANVVATEPKSVRLSWAIMVKPLYVPIIFKILGAFGIAGCDNSSIASIGFGKQFMLGGLQCCGCTTTAQLNGIDPLSISSVTQYT